MTPVPLSTLDSILTAQLAVAWAGEDGEEPRLRWWRTDLASEFGGKDLFQRLLPHSWQWAIFQAIREAARRRDQAVRAATHDADQLLSLFHLGFDLDERLDGRLADLKRGDADPETALPGLREVVKAVWDRAAFSEWVEAHEMREFVAAPSGRRMKGAAPDAPDRMVAHLVAGLAPLGDTYPLPHYRRT